LRAGKWDKPKVLKIGSDSHRNMERQSYYAYVLPSATISKEARGSLSKPAETDTWSQIANMLTLGSQLTLGLQH